MANSFFEAEFCSLQIELTKKSLKQFINKMMESACTLYWRYEGELIFLMIDTNHSIHEIPFKKKGNKLSIEVDSIKVNEAIIADSLEFVLTEYKGSGKIKKKENGHFYTKYVKDGKIKMISEATESTQKIMNSYGTVLISHDYTGEIQPETLLSIINLEIDYYLLELHDLLQEHNLDKAAETKQLLTNLQKKKCNIEKIIENNC